MNMPEFQHLNLQVAAAGVFFVLLEQVNVGWDKG